MAGSPGAGGKGRECVPWRALGRGFVDSQQEASRPLMSSMGEGGKGRSANHTVLPGFCFVFFFFCFVLFPVTAVTRSESRTDSKAREKSCLRKQK